MEKSDRSMEAIKKRMICSWAKYKKNEMHERCFKYKYMNKQRHVGRAEDREKTTRIFVSSIQFYDAKNDEITTATLKMGWKMDAHELPPERLAFFEHCNNNRFTFCSND